MIQMISAIIWIIFLDWIWLKNLMIWEIFEKKFKKWNGFFFEGLKIFKDKHQNMNIFNQNWIKINKNDEKWVKFSTFDLKNLKFWVWSSCPIENNVVRTGCPSKIPVRTGGSDRRKSSNLQKFLRSSSSFLISIPFGSDTNCELCNLERE